ncbi:hypothetical protein ABMY23_20620, partial [Vibrio vulnificus]
GRVFQSDGKEVKLTLTGYFWRYGIRKAIQVSIFRMNRFTSQPFGFHYQFNNRNCRYTHQIFL